ncbi:MAG TPA: ABC transporter substrate-binding protein, partial [Paraburkholderia sp.]|nr:ABC transporter substrate-binding protein [Paraburkholderia sp.]
MRIARFASRAVSNAASVPASVPASVSASVPSSVPSSVSASVPASASASITASITASISAAALLVSACLTGHAQAAPITVTDDTGASVTLNAPAQRVVSLAPHVTELLYAAGGGAQMAGAVTYSDYPPAARQLPRVGDNKALDLERIVALRPDLIVVWRH